MLKETIEDRLKGVDKMGLDMWLIGVKTGYVDGKIEGVFEELVYWRKANGIHGYFNRIVNGGVENLRMHHISPSELENLKGECEKALEKEDPSELMPLEQGLYFGNADYYEYDLEMLKFTAKRIGEILETTDYDFFLYMAYW